MGDQLHLPPDGWRTGPPRRRHGTVDLGGRERRVQPRSGDAGEGAGLRRVIALVGDPNQPGQRPQGREDLGGRWEEGDDPHAPPLTRARRHCSRRPVRNSRAPSRPNRTSAGIFDVASAPSWWYHPTDSASQSAARPRALPAPAMAATTMPAMAPPAIIPLPNRTPGPDSISASERFSDFTRCSTSQRTTPPANIPADVVIGRETPTAPGSAWMPASSRAMDRDTPNSTRAHGRRCVRIPSVISAIRVAFGESSRLSSRPRYSRTRPPIPGSTTYRISWEAGSTRYLPGGTACVST